MFGVLALALALGLPLTYAYGGARTFGYLAGAAGLSVVLIYLAVNLSAIRAFRTGFRAEFRVWRHLVIPAAAAVFFLFPLWGVLHPRGRALMDMLPFTALGWLGLGFIAAGVLRARQPGAPAEYLAGELAAVPRIAPARWPSLGVLPRGNQLIRIRGGASRPGSPSPRPGAGRRCRTAG